MTQYNRPEPLNVTDGNIVETFKRFRQEIEIYFLATETSEKPANVQVARLLNLLGSDALRLYNTFPKEDNPTVKKILDQFEKYCAPKRNEIMQHYKFFNRKQKQGEPFDIFLADLKSLVQGCNFQNMEDRMLRTQIVLGVFDKDVQTRLLREELTLKQVISYCTACEAAEKHKLELEGAMKVMAISKDGNADNRFYSNKSKVQDYENADKRFYNKNKACEKCDTSHVVGKCPAYGKQCVKCKRYGHFQKCCWSKTNFNVQQSRPKKSEDINEVRLNNNEDQSVMDDDFSINVLSIDRGIKDLSINLECGKEVHAIIYVNNVPVKFKIDTGSPVNIIPEAIMQEFQPRLQETNVQFVAFGGGKISPVGKFYAHCHANNIFSEEEIYVCKTDMALLGLKTSVKLKIVQVNNDVTCNTIDMEVEDLGKNTKK
uniref:Peptidase A2 domain-containing protein n=1 Tax=Cacopsylla melanoneura TaxID=428564 RepID=A0A8D8QRL7_9HEMI